MKLFHRIIIAVVLLIFMLPIGAAGDSTIIPDQVKIGIRYGTTSTPVIGIYSKNGLELGYFVGNDYKVINSFTQNSELLIRKDGFFMNLNGNFIEYQFDEQKDIDNSNLQGPIHIQIGDSFQTIEEAENYVSTLPALGESPYVVSEDGWKVWIGLYTCQANAEKALNRMKTSVPDLKLNIISQNKKRIQVVDTTGKVLFMYNTDNTNYQFKPMLSKDSLGLIRVDGKNFRGSIFFNRYDDSDLTVINQLNIEEYLYGVLPKEVSGSWPLEAQKAQAVAARNFAVVNINGHSKNGFDLCSTTHCQVYGGYDVEHPNSTKAVDLTKGKLLTYNGKVITAFYHSNSGGKTEDSENVWSFPLEYIRGVEDPYSIGQPNDNWTYVYTKQEIEVVLSSKDMSIGSLNSITPIEYSTNGRIIKLEVNGITDKKILEKDKIRNILGYNNIKSTWFQVETDSDVAVLSANNQSPTKTTLSSKFFITGDGIKKVKDNQNINIYSGKSYSVISSTPTKYVFIGKGWGHGLGMSQWGAKTMAEQGFTYEQILTHYYSGTKVE